MAKTLSALDACRIDLFTPEEELRGKYPQHIADRILRLRECYNYWLSNPDIQDKMMVNTIISRHRVSKSTAYSDLFILKQIIPIIGQSSRDYHRSRYNEMIMETYRMAKARKDTKTMEKAATSYAKQNRVDLEDEMTMPYDDIVPQPFCATLDVTVLGLQPIPDVYNHIDRLTKELSRDFTDIIDVDFEEADLEEKQLFTPLQHDTDQP